MIYVSTQLSSSSSTAPAVFLWNKVKLKLTGQMLRSAPDIDGWLGSTGGPGPDQTPQYTQLVLIFC